MQKTIFKGENLYAKVRYNIQHAESDLRWRLFIKDGEKDEVMLLCKHLNIYVSGQTYTESINGAGHYSILYKANRIIVDENSVGWIQ